MDKLQEARNKNPSLFMGVNRIEDVYDYLKTDGPKNLQEIIDWGIAKSTADKILDRLWRAGVLDTEVQRENGIATPYYSIKE